MQARVLFERLDAFNTIIEQKVFFVLAPTHAVTDVPVVLLRTDVGVCYLAPVKLADAWCFPGLMCMGKRSRALCFRSRRGTLLPALAGIHYA